MSETDPIQLRPSPSGSSSPARNRHTVNQPSQAPHKRIPPPVCFTRTELNQILNLYGRKVADGEWRDYALDMERDKAVFSIFRRTSEVPIYRIEKDPKLARKQGAFSVIAATGLILKRGSDLGRVLSVLDKRLKLVDAG